MAQKRSSAEAELQPLAIRSDENKRMKITPSAELRSNSSEETANSGTPALRSSPDVELDSETDRSSVSSEASDESEDEEDEEDESESESEDEEPDEETVNLPERMKRPNEERITLGGPAKPDMDPAKVMKEAKKIYNMLQVFMPMMREANADLLERGDDANMELVKEGEKHIEMDLGLGVLEEQKEEEALKEADSKEADEDQEDEGEQTPDVMRELLGAKTASVRPNIEEVNATGEKFRKTGETHGKIT